MYASVPNLIKQLFHSCLLYMRLVIWLCIIWYSTRAHDIIVKKFYHCLLLLKHYTLYTYLGRVRLGIFRNKNVFRNIFRLFCCWEQNSQNGIQVFRNENSSQTNAYLHYSSYSYSGFIPNERALSKLPAFTQYIHFQFSFFFLQFEFVLLCIYFVLFCFFFPFNFRSWYHKNSFSLAIVA